jgi:hypothetical protein
MFNAFSDTLVQVSFQNHLADFVQGVFSRVYLYKDILAGEVPVNYFVNCLNLPHYFINPPMQIFRIHTLAHIAVLLSVSGNAIAAAPG